MSPKNFKIAVAVSFGCSKWGTWPQFSIHFNSLHFGNNSTNLLAVEGSNISSFLPHINSVSCCTKGTLVDTICKNDCKKKKQIILEIVQES